MKEHSQSFPHPKIRNERIIVTWSTGYRVTEIWFQGRLLKTVDNVQDLLKKVRFKDPELGDVEIFLSESPYRLNLKVDKLHSHINADYPKKNIKAISLWMIPGLFTHSLLLVVLLFEYLKNPNLHFNEVYVAYNITLFLLFLSSFILIRLSYPMSYMIGFFAYWTQWFLLLYLLSEAIIGTGIVVIMSVYFLYCSIMILPIRKLVAYVRHKPFDFGINEEVLDS